MSIGSIAGSIAKKAVGNAGKDRMRQRMADINKRNPDEDAEGGDLQTEQASSVPAKPITTKPVEQAPEQTIEQSRQFREELDSPWTRALQSPEAKEHNRRQAEAVEAGATSFEDGAARQYIDPKQFRENAVGDAWREETQKLAAPEAPEPRTDLNWKGAGGYSYDLNLDDPSNPSVTWTDSKGRTGVWTPEDEGAWNAIMKERDDQLDGVTPAPKVEPAAPSGDAVDAVEPEPVHPRLPGHIEDNVSRVPMRPEEDQVSEAGEPAQRLPEDDVSKVPMLPEDRVSMPLKKFKIPPQPPENRVSEAGEPVQIAQQSDYTPALADAGKEGGQDNPMPAAKATGATRASEIVEDAVSSNSDFNAVLKDLYAVAQTYPDEAEAIQKIVNNYAEATGARLAAKAKE